MKQKDTKNELLPTQLLCQAALRMKAVKDTEIRHNKSHEHCEKMTSVIGDGECSYRKTLQLKPVEIHSNLIPCARGRAEL